MAPNTLRNYVFSHSGNIFYSLHTDPDNLEYKSQENANGYCFNTAGVNARKLNENDNAITGVSFTDPDNVVVVSRPAE